MGSSEFLYDEMMYVDVDFFPAHNPFSSAQSLLMLYAERYMQMSLTFTKLFQTATTKKSKRDAFLARVFGFFSEEIVRIWSADDRAAYFDLGRPTLKRPNEARGYTLDFTLQSRTTKQVYISELKCELEYENYRYLTLTSAAQLAHHQGQAFQRLLSAAHQSTDLTAAISGKPIGYQGAILVWGSVTPQGRDAVKAAYGFADILSIENMISQLRAWNNPHYEAFLSEREAWMFELFQGLRSI